MDGELAGWVVERETERQGEGPGSVRRRGCIYMYVCLLEDYLLGKGGGSRVGRTKGEEKKKGRKEGRRKKEAKEANWGVGWDFILCSSSLSSL